MLAPENRSVLGETLRPPAGYELDRAVGTTFSLDLLSLLTVPVSFALFDLHAEDGVPDPMATLEALRRHADRISLFCQAGRIQIPRDYQKLEVFVEESVVEVQAPGEHGVFHPKVWLLRFVSGDGGPVVHRLLVLTRNLTFDRSWDLVLVLEGPLGEDRPNAFARNHPLGDFIAGLADLAQGDLAERHREAVELLASEIRRVEFELPAGFSEIAFHPLGIPGAGSWPFGGGLDRVLAVSPFLGPRAVRRLAEGSEGVALVSRPDALLELGPKPLEGWRDLYVLSQAGIDPEDSEGSSEPEDAREGDPIQGLHAKVYAADAGRDGRLWVGSANLTDAAFGANVEFLVELRGKKSVCGVDAILSSGESGQAGFLDLLEPWERPEEADEVDPERRAKERALEGARRTLASSRMVLRAAEDETWSLALESTEEIPLPEGAFGIRVWPITFKEAAGARELEAAAGSLAAGTLARWQGLEEASLTPFLAIEIRLEGFGERARFVRNLVLEGAPAERKANALLHLLDSREKVLRFLLFLLASEGGEAGLSLDPVGLPPGTTGGRERPGMAEIPLLESLLRALAHEPEALRPVGKLLEDLRGSESGRELLPPGMEEVWDALWQAGRGRIVP